MEKMFYALSAIGVMFASNFAITQARKITVKPFRFALSTVAYVGLLVAFVLMLAVLVTF
ncbi:DUF2768 family protein [Aneurinibacillus terranovensis]|uniref:DUF2768 family protein n=1 Tax=Aneurinibacillus terranovensis TaxID=278991 RepID=UPI0004122AA5|nr:DUF2768 family protein [Aneurinibacillus terranovensis]